VGYGHAGYYDGATELYEYGWGTSFHFSRFYKGEGFNASVSLARYVLSPISIAICHMFFVLVIESGDGDVSVAVMVVLSWSTVH
jgi:hypothetical protein